MVRVKQSVKQSNFTLGEIREEYLEDDTGEIRAQSLKKAINVFPNGVKGLIRAPGRKLRGGFLALTNPVMQEEIEPEEGARFLLIISHQLLSIMDASGAVVQSFAAPWDTIGSTVAAPPVWVVPARNIIYFGGAAFPHHVLSYNSGSWSFSQMAFEAAGSGQIAQPYYSFERGVTITVSGVSGSVTISASSGVFSPQYVGLRLRYHGTEIDITSYTDANTLVGTVVANLPPSFDVVVQDASGFSDGQVVNGVDSEYSGYISDIDYAANKLKLATLRGHEGPFDGAVAELIAGPNTTSKLVNKTLKSSLYASPYWEEPVFSPVRGYAASAAGIGGRLIMTDFDSHPGLVVASSSKSYRDFVTGTNDDDAFIRTVGERETRVRHVLDAGDLILLADNGAYSVEAKDGVAITPNNFQPKFFDGRGANAVKPIVVGSSVLYVSISGRDLLTAAQSGNIYLKWSVTDISNHSSHLVDNPVQICPPPINAPRDERFVLVVNQDGSGVAITYNDEIEKAGFFPLFHNSKSNLGNYPDPWGGMGVRMAAPFNGTIWAMIDHEFGAVSHQMESYEFDVKMHSVLEAEGGSTIDISRFAGAPISIWGGGYHHGEFEAYEDAEAYIADLSPGTIYQVGIAYNVCAGFWPVELINSPRVGMIRARTIRVAMSMRNTTSYFVKRNRTTRDVGFYELGDDFGQPPTPRTEVRKFPVLGNRDHPEIAVGQSVPGEFELLAYTAEVQG